MHMFIHQSTTYILKAGRVYTALIIYVKDLEVSF